jgi:hypothetical protein
MKNLHLIPTEKPSRLWLYKNFDNLLTGLTVEKSKDIYPQHIYITSDGEIKEGDWIYYTSALGFCKTTIGSKGLEQEGIPAKKIILTTDAQLIADGVQAIDDKFLKWFINNPSCEMVQTIYGLFNPMGRQVDPMNLGS